MELYALLSQYVFLACLFLGIYVLILEPRDRIHQLFFLLSLSEGLWNLFSMFVFRTNTEEQLWSWFRIAATFGILFTSLLLHFILTLTQRAAKKRWILLIYLFSLPVHYRNWTSSFIFDQIRKVETIWVFQPAVHSFWMYYWWIYSHSMAIISLVLLHRWRKRSTSKRIQHQAKIIFYSLLLFLTTASINDYFIAPRIRIPPISPIYFLIFIAGTSYAMIKYRFLSITHKTVCKDILQNMDVAVILLDLDSRVMMMNRKAGDLLQQTEAQVQGRNVSQVFRDTRVLQNGIQRILEDRIKTFTCTVQIPRLHDMMVLKLTLSLVKDRVGEKLGVLLIGQENNTLKQFLKRFRITWREWEIIQHVLSGLSNKGIAEELSISERTVKSHVTHIYNKLGIKNKVQLLKILGEFHVPAGLPEPQSVQTKFT